MHAESTIDLYSRMFGKLGSKWPDFIRDLRKAAEKDDPDQIFLTDFTAICSKYHLELSTAERQDILFAFPGRDENNKVRINIYPIYD